MKEWYVLRSKPKKESLSATLLDRAGIEVYLPQVESCRPRGKQPVLEPFFPCYFFARLDSLLGEIRLARYTVGVQYVVGYAYQPSPVPDGLVISIKERLERTRGLADNQDLRPGDSVVVTNGPLRGVEAIFEQHLSASGRVRVLIQLLERLCRTDLHVGQLRRTGKAVGAA